MKPAAATQEFKIPEKLKNMSKEAMISKLEKDYKFFLPMTNGKALYVSKENAAYFLAQHMGLLNTKQESDVEIDARLTDRFDAMEDLTDMAIEGIVRSLIIVGAPGLGKTYSIDKKLRAYDPQQKRHTPVRGYSTAVNLYKLLWDHRHEGSILVLDDCDAVRDDEVGMNLLKVATDTSDIRRVSYMSEGQLLSDKDGSRVPKSFEYEGTIIFITNEDLELQASGTNAMAQHMGALINRAHYINLTLRDRRDALVRIRQVVYKHGMLDSMPERDRKEVMAYVEANYLKLRDLSLRTVLKIADMKKVRPDTWQSRCQVTMFPS